MNTLMPTVNKCRSGAKGPATSMLHFLSLNVNSVSLNLSTQHAICAAGVQAVFREHNKHTTSQREGSDTNWWMKRLYMHVGGEEHEILFWVYLNTIYISHMTRQFKTEKGGELPEYLPGNVIQTHPSTFRWLVQIQATPQRKQSNFHERHIQQLMSCMDQSVFCWADVENKKNTQNNYSPEWQSHQRCHRLNRGRWSLNCLYFCSGLLQARLLRFVLTAVMLYLLQTQQDRVVSVLLAAKLDSSSLALGYTHTLTGW